MLEAHGKGWASMVDSFAIVRLEAGEELVFGIAVETSTKSFSIQGVNVGGTTTETRRGITTRRVIVESSSGDVKQLANGDVRTVQIAREKQMGVEVLRIVSVTDASGRSLGIGLGGIDPGHEARLKELFPAATLVAKKKGFFSFLRRASP